MRTHILSCFLYLFTIVWAGGYAGCLERIYMYQAYKIDELNPIGQRIMGSQCKGADWHNPTKTCTGIWRLKTGTAPNNRMTYEEFLKELGSVQSGRTYAVYVGGNVGGRLDIKATALATYTVYTSSVNSRVKDFPANAFMRDTVEWNDAIKKASQVVERAYVNNRDTVTDEQKQLFKDFDDTRQLTVEARIGDQGSYLLTAARAKLGPKGITVRTKSMGTNPITGGSPWDTVDWSATIQDAENAGISDARGKVQTAAKEFYSQNSAREHIAVINSYRRAQDTTRNCGRI